MDLSLSALPLYSECWRYDLAFGADGYTDPDETRPLLNPEVRLLRAQDVSERIVDNYSCHIQLQQALCVARMHG